MKTALLVIATLLLIAVPAQAQKVYIDYDQTVDFSALETFRYEESGLPNLADDEPLTHKYIIHAIVSQLESAGLKEVEDDPDFYITYHADSSTEYSVDTMSMSYGYGGGWRWGGYGYYGPAATSSTVRAYEKGTLIIDAWDPESEELIWRGTSTATMSDDPARARNKIDKGLKKIVKKWDKEYRKKK